MAGSFTKEKVGGSTAAILSLVKERLCCVALDLLDVRLTASNVLGLFDQSEQAG